MSCSPGTAIGCSSGRGQCQAEWGEQLSDVAVVGAGQSRVYSLPR